MRAAVDVMRAADAGREAERLAMKYAAMASSQFSFLRGTCQLFFDRLTATGAAPTGPPTWICGDLHLENFGAYLGDNGLTYFDLSDFDEALLAPAPWDIVRLATSVLVAAPELGIADKDASILCRAAIESWQAELALGRPRWIERRIATGIIADLMNGLKGRRTDKFLDRRSSVKKGTRRLTLGTGKALPVSDDDRQAIEDFALHLVPPQDEPDFFDVLECARRIAGTGSLGVPRFVILVEGDGSPDDNALLDLKSARPSAVLPYSPVPQPKFDGEADRIVAIAQRCLAIAPSFLQSVGFQGGPFVLRELQPTADRLNLARDARRLPAFAEALGSMAKLAAWAELRATGRGGSATADALIDYAHDPGTTSHVEEAAHAMADLTVRDWKDYVAAYHDGEFGTDESAETAPAAQTSKRDKRA